MAKSSAPRNRRQRERERRGMAVGQVAYDSDAVTVLIMEGRLTESESFDRAAINQALTDLIANYVRNALRALM